MYTYADTLIGHCHISSSQKYNFIVRFSSTTLVIALCISPRLKVFRKQTRELGALIICNVHCVFRLLFLSSGAENNEPVLITLTLNPGLSFSIDRADNKKLKFFVFSSLKFITTKIQTHAGKSIPNLRKNRF